MIIVHNVMMILCNVMMVEHNVRMIVHYVMTVLHYVMMRHCHNVVFFSLYGVSADLVFFKEVRDRGKSEEGEGERNFF